MSESHLDWSRIQEGYLLSLAGGPCSCLKLT
jgi:hypothetical protein